MIFIQDINNQIAGYVIEILNKQNYKNLMLVGERKFLSDYSFVENISITQLHETLINYQWEAEFFIFIYSHKNKLNLTEVSYFCSDIQLPMIIINTENGSIKKPDKHPFFCKILNWNTMTEEDQFESLISSIENRS
ncbi:hypothetical protein [Mangrovivirga cuniculi]|uniref:Uncharacterized protein n=1 Tax=Mangrovivirga cuniculi TaxID=2715131 RepID=A0A4D7JKW1_9BACT|nr:hypothetical protein [Mangrovivirga cuniculi]QCK14120.1 hypothetical protein DCC35_04825 [Mangrovivirga cuniculi]